nr:unnamed protein product [Callosobruchus chinensis]
MLFREANSTHR